MTKLARKDANSIAKFDPTAAAMKVHTMAAAEKIAARAKDVFKLKAAIKGKLEAQRDFAAAYRATITPSREVGGPGRGKKGGQNGPPFSPEEWCERFGFDDRTVRRWAERLLEPEAFETELSERLSRVRQIVEMEQAANFSSESIEWYTPARYIDAARTVLGTWS